MFAIIAELRRRLPGYAVPQFVREVPGGEFKVPLLAHACMEPENCTALVTDAGCEVWSGNQAALLYRAEFRGTFGEAGGERCEC